MYPFLSRSIVISWYYTYKYARVACWSFNYAASPRALLLHNARCTVAFSLASSRCLKSHWNYLALFVVMMWDNPLNSIGRPKCKSNDNNSLQLIMQIIIHYRRWQKCSTLTITIIVATYNPASSSSNDETTTVIYWDDLIFGWHKFHWRCSLFAVYYIC